MINCVNYLILLILLLLIIVYKSVGIFTFLVWKTEAWMFYLFNFLIEGRKCEDGTTWGLKFWMSYCFYVPPRQVGKLNLKFFFFAKSRCEFLIPKMFSPDMTHVKLQKNSQAHNHFPVHLISTNSTLFICSGLIYRKHDSSVIIPFFKGRAPK